ncbi:MAG: glycosyltransferase family 2 protein [Chlorobium sp.]|nr:glycosyltransferase family 2 protein [Chlorobium sp.]
MEKRELQVSVAILTWNRRQDVIRAIESVLHQTYLPVEIVVVDSASTDDTVEAIEAKYPKIQVIRLHRNLGCPEGRNVALANCKGDIIFALDDDGWLEPNTLAVCVEKFRQNEKVAVVACRILAPDQKKDGLKMDEVAETFSGGACAIRKEALAKVGYYPSDFFRQAEEIDLGLRLIDKGYEILSCSEAVMYHEPSPVNRNFKLFMYYQSRNELYTVLRRYPWYLVLPMVAQKLISWGYLGMRKGVLWYTLMGAASVIPKIPHLLMHRSPVSFETMRFLLTLKARRRRMHASRAD